MFERREGQSGSTWKKDWLSSEAARRQGGVSVAPHSSTFAWKIPWTEEPNRLQSMGSQRVGHSWATSLSLSVTKAGFHWQAEPPSREWARDKGICRSIELNFPEQQRRPLWLSLWWAEETHGKGNPTSRISETEKNTSNQRCSYRQEETQAHIPSAADTKAAPWLLNPPSEVTGPCQLE